MEYLSSFSRKLNRHYWMTDIPQSPHQDRPCFTRQEMGYFDRMTVEEVRLAFKMRMDHPAVEIAWPADWRMFRISQELPAPDMEGARRAGEIVRMLRERSFKAP